MTAERWRIVTVLPLALSAPLAMTLLAQQPVPRAGQGVFTAGQAAAGRAVYQASCSSCHLPDLAGRNEAPQLAGNNFMNTWRARSTRDLFEFIQSTMPPASASLNDEQYLAVTAFLLQANGAPAGTQPFTPTTAVPIGSAATGTAPAPAASDAGGGGRAAGAGRGQPPAGAGRGGAPANAGPLGVTVAGTVKNFVPVSDEMLRVQDPADWLMARRNYQGWSYSPLTQITRDNVKELQLAWVWEMNEGQGNEPSPLVHNGIIYLTNLMNIVQALDARDRRADLGKPSRPQRAHRSGGDAQHGDGRRQGFCRHHRRATGRARRADRQDDLGHADRRPREGLRQHRRSDRDQGRRHQRPGRLRSVRQRRLLDQRLRREHRQAVVEVQHRRAHRHARRRNLGQARRTTCASAARPGFPAATIPIWT